jgi:hypothetical protein
MLHVGFFLGLFFDPEDESNMFLFTQRLTLNRLQSSISQEMELFITTAV